VCAAKQKHSEVEAASFCARRWAINTHPRSSPGAR
jgi:hypothetical protein